MDCPRCGTPLDPDAAFCSNCGLKIEQPTRVLASNPPDSPPGEPTVPGSRRGCRTALTVGGIALLVVVIVGLIAAAAVYFGLRDREQVQARQAEAYYEQGEAYMQEGQYELAIAAYDQALMLSPDHPFAAQRREEAMALLSGAPTPTSVAQETSLEELWREHLGYVATADWLQAVATAEQIMLRDPEYQRQELDANLYDAFLALAREAIEEDRMEEAQRYLSRALDIRPDDSQAIHLQNLARLYADGLRYYGADWASAIDRFEALYTIDPQFKDVTTRLRSAYIAYGQQLADDKAWCEAATQFELALELATDASLEALAADAASECEAARTEEAQTPGVVIDAPAGTYVGREVQAEAVGSDKMFIRGHVYDASGAPVVGTRVKIQAWDFSVYATTDDTGQFSFDGLANPVTYTLTLADLPSLPLDVQTAWGRLSWVVFEQAK